MPKNIVPQFVRPVRAGSPPVTEGIASAGAVSGYVVEASNGNDDAAAFQEAAANKASEAITVAPGTYTVTSNIINPSFSPFWVVQAGANLDVASLQAVFRGSSTPFDISGMSKSRYAEVSGTNLPGNSHMKFQSYRISATGATVGYQKNALYIGVYQTDPSTGPGNGGSGQNVNKDAVGIDTRSIISGSNPAGRGWGLITTAEIQSGTADGQINGIEVDLINNGSSMSNVDDGAAAFKKTGVLLVTVAGTGTHALCMTRGGGSGWYNGLFARATDLVDDPASSFIRLYDVFRVDRNGWLRMSNTAAAPTSNPTAGFIIYVDPADDKLKCRGKSGTITTLALP